MSSSDSTLGASSKRPVLYWWLTLLVVLMVSAIASPRTKSSGDTSEDAARIGSSNELLREHGLRRVRTVRPTWNSFAVLDGSRFRMFPIDH